MKSVQDLVSLGKTDIQISRVGVGAWAWGDRRVWGYGGGTYSDADLRAAFDTSLANGANWFDTAEVYGLGRSEKLLGKFMPTAAREVLVATKFFPLPWRVRKAALLRALKKSLARLGRKIGTHQFPGLGVHSELATHKKPGAHGYALGIGSDGRRRLICLNHSTLHDNLLLG